MSTLIMIAVLAALFWSLHLGERRLATSPIRRRAREKVTAAGTAETPPVPDWARDLFGPDAEDLRSLLVDAFEDEERSMRSLVGGHLTRLVVNEVPLRQVVVDPDTGAGRLVFCDGTLVVCSGASNLSWLSLRAATEPARLVSVWVGMPRSRLRFRVGDEVCVLTTTGIVLVPAA